MLSSFNGIKYHSRSITIMTKRIFLTILVLLLLASASLANAQTGGEDSDGDGLPDSVDQCPTVPGPRENNGCPTDPDTDGDGLPDSADSCPTVAGPRENGGCPTDPDTDGDGLPDSADSCPTVAGPRENGGCPVTPTDPTGGSVPTTPDSDGDGVNDSDDACPSVPGDPSNGGCPRPEIEPVPMPTEGQCVASPEGTVNVNIRQYPTVFSDEIGVLEVNQMAPVLDAMQGAYFIAEPEWVSEDDFSLWYQIDDNGSIGWVAAAVVRLGGDCSAVIFPQFETPDSFDSGQTPDDEQGYLHLTMEDVIITSFNPTTGDTHYPPAGESISFNFLTSTLEIGDGETSVMDIIVGAGPGGGPQATPNQPYPLAILYCPNADDTVLPSVDECIILTNATNTSDLLDTINIVCLPDATGMLHCGVPQTAPSPDPTACVTVAGHEFCAMDYVPEEMCTPDPTDGHLICMGGINMSLIPLNPENPFPGINILAPGDGSVRWGLLLPAVQKVREAAR
ncbi:MAG: thrombospondin type 3 repeat-containing protein [Anaerolineae bacterium]|nr:thrombospondin type 3 repeat-containing protein [Anaerolineae bacterium]